MSVGSGYGLADTPPVGTYYCTYADMLAEIRDLAAITPTGYDPETWTYNQIARAQWIHIDPVLQSIGCTTPLTTTDNIIRGLTICAATYMILRPLYVKQDPNISDWVDAYMSQVKEILGMIADGRLTLNITGMDTSTSIQGTNTTSELDLLDMPRSVTDSEGIPETW